MRGKALLILILCGMLCGVFSLAAAADDKIVIGFSMDNLRLERWQHDRDLFVERAKELGAEVLVQSANSDDMLQVAQAENLITQGVDVLVILPHNGKIMGSVVAEAHRNGVPVLAYDRLLLDCDLDCYISFDNVRVGELQAKYLVDRKPEGRYFLLGGSPTDNNAYLVRQGQMNIIQPYVDAGKIKIVGDQWAKDWLPQEAMNIIENALTALNNQIDVIVASNDSTAGGAVQALADQGLDGKVLVSGQDADLAACQRVVEGTQTVTVYKPIRKLAYRAAEVAVAMAKGEPLDTGGVTTHNGMIDVPSILLDPIPVGKDEMMDTVIADGFHKMEDVYKNISKDQWPTP
ncbi:MAG: D-xylose ABC transporter substrate-binding protein [Firmicutes bacterium]|nr:D-xylose ABC transporter substrate-binding protein [Bacillota bacterium]